MATSHAAEFGAERLRGNTIVFPPGTHLYIYTGWAPMICLLFGFYCLFGRFQRNTPLHYRAVFARGPLVGRRPNVFARYANNDPLLGFLGSPKTQTACADNNIYSRVRPVPTFSVDPTTEDRDRAKRLGILPTRAYYRRRAGRETLFE